MRPLPLADAPRTLVTLGDEQLADAAPLVATRLVPPPRVAAFAAPGAAIGAVRFVQLPRLAASGIVPAIALLTLGLGDLPRLLAGDAAGVVADLRTHGGFALDALRRFAPVAPVALVTLYDPLDGADARLAAGVSGYNEVLRELAAGYDAAIADACAAFVGHGAAAGDPLSPERRPAHAALYLRGAHLTPVPNDFGAAALADSLLTALQ